MLTQRRGATFAGLDSIPPNEKSRYPAAWYCKQGRSEGKPLYR
jgi:hypothetical protein